MSSPGPDSSGCVTYLENYLDCVENFPDELQRYVTRLTELEVTYQNFVQDVESLIQDELIKKMETSTASAAEKRAVGLKIQAALINAQEIGDQKLEIVQQLQDLIEVKGRKLDNDYRSVDSSFLADVEQQAEPAPPKKESSVASSPSTSAVTSTSSTSTSSVNNGNASEQRQSKRPRRSRAESDYSIYMEGMSHHHHHHHYEHTGNTPVPRMTATLPVNTQKKNASVAVKQKKKRKSKQKEDSDNIPVDPDEPTYCLCDQISYGEMICCDNDLCPIEWFHFSCVSLSNKPKGKWFCPKCRGDRANVMKPKAQFLKELERYNREKEEKARGEMAKKLEKEAKAAADSGSFGSGTERSTNQKKYGVL